MGLARHEERACLKNGLAKKHAGRDGRARVMAAIKVLILAPCAAGGKPVGGFGDDFVHKQKRRTVRDEFCDCVRWHLRKNENARADVKQECVRRSFVRPVGPGFYHTGLWPVSEFFLPPINMLALMGWNPLPLDPAQLYFHSRARGVSRSVGGSGNGCHADERRSDEELRVEAGEAFGKFIVGGGLAEGALNHAHFGVEVVNH